MDPAGAVERKEAEGDTVAVAPVTSTGSSAGGHMDTTPAAEIAPVATAPVVGPSLDSPAPVEQELLVEDVSIDGMCGVY